VKGLIMKNVLVIGGGIASSIYAYRVKKEHPDYQVTMLEQSDKILKRVLVSGNGRSNFFNEQLLKNTVYQAYNYMSFLEYFDLTSYSEKLLDMLSNDLNFSYYFDSDGRAYPFSNTAESLWLVLVKGLEEVGVKIITDTKVTGIDPETKIVSTEYSDSFKYDTLFIGAGGSAYDRRDNAFKKVLAPLNIEYIKQTSALCPLKVKQDLPQILNGVRLKGNLVLYKDDTPFYDELGEILFKEDGISGICVFDASLFINKESNFKIVFNPFMHDDCMTSLNGKKSLSYLEGLFPSRLINYFRKSGYKEMDDDDVLKTLTFDIKEKYPLKNSQISLGGINPTEINSNLSLMKYENIFVGGEIVDLHGICGGYNIGSAMLMGYKAAGFVD